MMKVLVDGLNAAWPMADWEIRAVAAGVKRALVPGSQQEIWQARMCDRCAAWRLTCGCYEPHQFSTYPCGHYLFVREPWAGRNFGDEKPPLSRKRHYTLYRATAESPEWDDNHWHDFGDKWRSAKYMPRWAARFAIMILSPLRIVAAKDLTDEDVRETGLPERLPFGTEEQKRTWMTRSPRENFLAGLKPPADGSRLFWNYQIACTTLFFPGDADVQTPQGENAAGSSAGDE